MEIKLLHQMGSLLLIANNSNFMEWKLNFCIKWVVYYSLQIILTLWNGNLSNSELNTVNFTYSNAICKIFHISHSRVEDISLLHRNLTSRTADPSIGTAKGFITIKSYLSVFPLESPPSSFSFVYSVCALFLVSLSP